MRRKLAIAVTATILFVSQNGVQPASQRPYAQGGLWTSVVQTWFDRGDYEKAHEWLKDRLKESADPDVQYAYLYCLYREGKYGKVIALARSKKFGPAVGQRRGVILVGLTLWRIGRVQSALENWLRLLRANPRDELAWECIRVAFLSLDRFQRPEIFPALLDAVSQSRFATSFIQGLGYYTRGNRELAEARLLEARSLYPESKVVARALRDYYRRFGDMEKALAFNRWLELRGERTEGSGTSREEPKSSDFSTLYPTIQPSGQPGGPYRLPWPAGRTLFCGSHEGCLKSPHQGRGRNALDFFLPPGTPVLAARGGVVRSLQGRNKAVGRHEFETYVMIDHGDGTFGRYYHLRGGSVRVKQGQPVRRGQILATAGRSARCQSQHLHFEVVRKASLRLREPHLYRRWETIPVDFVETRHLKAADIPGRWLASVNRVVP